MTTESRFDRQLPAILEDLYLGPSPDYRDEVLAAAPARGSGRPGPSQEGGSPWLTSPAAPRSRHGFRGERSGWRSAHRRAPRRGDRDLRRHPSDASSHRRSASARQRPDRLRDARRHLRRRIRSPASATAIVTDPRARRGTRLLAGRDAIWPSGDRSKAASRWPRTSSSSSPMDRTRLVVTAAPIAGSPEAARVVTGFEVDPRDRAERRRRLAASMPRARQPVRTDPGRQAAPTSSAVPATGRGRAADRPNPAATRIPSLSYDLATGHETMLAADLAGDDSGAARWSPDGSQVVYNATPTDEPDSSRLFVVRADGSGTRQLATAARHLARGRPSVVAGRHQIAFTRYRAGRPDHWDVRPIGIYSMADGTGAVRRTATARRSRPVPGGRRHDRQPEVKPSTSTGRPTAVH